MSYDLQIWSTQPVSVRGLLPETDRWRLEGDLWTRGGKDWLLSVGGSEQVLAEDIPEEVEKQQLNLTAARAATLPPRQPGGAAPGATDSLNGEYIV